MSESLSRNEPAVLSRRKVLFWGLSASGVLALSHFTGFFSRAGAWVSLFGPKRQGISFDAGKAEDYRLGSVDSRWKEKYGVWIVRTLDGFYALSARTNSGETTDWDEKKQAFRARVSGTLYYKSGVPFSAKGGPAFGGQLMKRTSLDLTPNGRLRVPWSPVGK